MTALVTLAMASPAFAQSEISCTLTTGTGSTSCTTATTTTTGGSTLTGTVVAPPGSGTLTGTVVAPTTGGGGSAGGGGGGGGSGSGNNTIDICPNLDGMQTVLPSGYGLSNGNCIVLGTGGGTGDTGTTLPGGGSVLGTGTEIPNVPNTGSGGNLLAALLLLVASGTIAVFGALGLRRMA